MKTILNALFDENLNYSVTLFLLFLFIIECVYLCDKDRKKQITSRCALIITTISVAFAGVVIVTSDAADDLYTHRIKPQETGCVFDIFKEHDYYYYAFFLHYFEDKQLYICDDVDTKLDIAAHLMKYEKSLPIEVGGANYTSSAVSSKMGEIDDKTHALEKDGRRFILDKTWKKADRIICIQNNDQVYFMSEQLYLDASVNDCAKDYLSEKELALGSQKYMEKQRGEGILKQTAVLTSFFVLGYLIMLLSFKGKNKWLSFFMSFPMGISLAGTMGVLFIYLGLPFRKITILATFFVLIVLEMFLVIRKKELLHKKTVVVHGLCAVALNWLVSYLMIYSKMGDSFYKIGYGIFMAEFLPSRTEICDYMDYGLLDPIIHAIGWKFHADFVYGLYFMMAICIMGILATSMVYLFEINQNKILLIFMLICQMILVTNDDYLGISTWVLTNGIVACLYLIVFVVAVLAIKNQVRPTFLIAIVAMSSIVARVEGTCYMYLILVVLCGIKEYRERYWMINVIVGAEAIIWQLYLGMFLDTTSFLTPEKSFIAIAGGVVTIMAPFFLKIRGSLFDWIRSNYYKLCVGAFALISLVFVMGGTEMGYSTAKIFFRHFGASDCSNSAGIWGFSLLMLPLLLKHRNKMSKMMIAYIITSLLMTYVIFAVRTGDPIHEMYYDSCRRVLSQIMPTMMFVIMYIFYSITYDNRLFLDDEKNV